MDERRSKQRIWRFTPHKSNTYVLRNERGTVLWLTEDQKEFVDYLCFVQSILIRDEDDESDHNSDYYLSVKEEEKEDLDVTKNEEQ